jgi:hypothetical protein
LTTAKLKINLFGEIWKLKQILIKEDQELPWLKIAERLRKPLHEAIIDPFFYHYLNDKKIKSMEDIEGFQIEGLLNNAKNQIEIWYQRKKVQKLKINDLDSSLLLFPLYTVSLTKLAEDLSSGIYVEQKEIGLFGNFEIAEVPNFNIENLEFELLEFKERLLVQSLKYLKNNIKVKKKDTVVIYQNAFKIE